MKHSFFRRFFIIGLLAVASLSVRADEGMWDLTNLPLATLKAKYGFEPTKDWTEHLMLSSVRFPHGSGSFISANGLVLTNHHVASDYIGKISSAAKNYHEDGHLARTQQEEIPLKDLELNRLTSIEDVTARVKASVRSDMDSAQATLARRAVMAEIEKESYERTGLKSEVVTLYQGGLYHLYRYKVYTDVRLVFAPEFKIAFFGGDPDNFEYPRFDLDMTIVRAYEDGKPAKIDHYLKWSANGAKEDELVFVSGHPGRTNRIYTVDALKFMADVRIPYNLTLLRRREIALQLYAQKGAEQKRRAQDEFFSIQNSRKNYLGQQGGLQQNALFASKQREELLLRAKVAANPKLKHLAPAWARVAQAQKDYGAILEKRALLELGHGFYSQLFSTARTLVRLAEENAKPNGDRLAEYRDSNRKPLEAALYSDAEIYPDLEVALLTDSLALLAERLGYNDPLVQAVLGGHSPAEVAQDAVDKTVLFDVDVRKLIAEGGGKAIADSYDPFIRMAIAVDVEARKLRKEYEEKVEEVERQAYAQIAEALFSVKGTSVYPDATFTLRLAYGSVKGYSDQGKAVPPWTNIGGAFEHETKHGAKDPWELPESWTNAKSKLDLTTPFNFVCTADIIGGNSGSPVVNQNGELVGLIFDGNIQSLTANYIYTDKVSRAVSVHSAGIIEALRNVYGATELLTELGK